MKTPLTPEQLDIVIAKFAQGEINWYTLEHEIELIRKANAQEEHLD